MLYHADCLQTWPLCVSKLWSHFGTLDVGAAGLCRLLGGLAWVGVLTFGVVSEQVKTRLEQAQEEKGGKVTCWA